LMREEKKRKQGIKKTKKLYKTLNSKVTPLVEYIGSVNQDKEVLDLVKQFGKFLEHKGGNIDEFLKSLYALHDFSSQMFIMLSHIYETPPNRPQDPLSKFYLEINSSLPESTR